MRKTITRSSFDPTHFHVRGYRGRQAVTDPFGATVLASFAEGSATMTDSDAQRHAVNQRTAVEVCDESGLALYGLANLLFCDADVAEDVVVAVITEAVRASDISLQRPDLVQQIYAEFQSAARREDKARTSVSALSHTEKAALGLAISGARDYRWVARVMGVSPDVILQALRSALTHD